MLAAIVAIFSCCSSKKDDRLAESADSRYPSTNYTFDTTGHANSKPDNPQFNYSYKLTLPDEGVAACADSIRMYIIASATDYKKDDLETARKMKINAMSSLDEEEEFEFREMFGSDEIPWSFNCESECSFEDGDVYVSLFKFSSYEGGAHGYHCTRYDIWDKANAKRITYHDIFVEDSEEKLSSMIVDSLCKIMRVNKPEDLTDAGILDVKEIHPNDNISVDADFLTFNYAPYEIAAYAVGELSVRFSFADIKGMMNPDSPVFKFAE